MAKRVLIGNRSSGGYGFYVSKLGTDVTTCDKKDLLFDSTQGTGGAGQVYAGGFLSSLGNTTQNFLTTGSKPNLGYIPLVITSEDYSGEWSASWGGGYQFNERWQSRVDMIETTSSTIAPSYLDPDINSQDRRSSNEAVYGGSHACTNITFIVLAIPCAYGYMNSTYFVEG